MELAVELWKRIVQVTRHLDSTARARQGSKKDQGVISFVRDGMGGFQVYRSARERARGHLSGPAREMLVNAKCEAISILHTVEYRSATSETNRMERRLTRMAVSALAQTSSSDTPGFRKPHHYDFDHRSGTTGKTQMSVGHWAHMNSDSGVTLGAAHW